MSSGENISMVCKRLGDKKMSSSGVGPEQDPLERYYRVEEIERVLWEEEKKGSKGPPEPPDGGGVKPGWAAFFALLLDHVIGFIKQAIQRGISTAAAEPVREDLVMLKAAFEIMKLEDRSQDAPFLKNLSKLWLNVLEHSIRLQTKGSLGQQLKALIKNIESYPEKATHTFGYYLDEFAGQKWLPFPYMELIQEMHHLHSLDPGSSLLTRWTKMIEEILNSE
jgi:hypothetical protein